jgi:hypothetical protein
MDEFYRNVLELGPEPTLDAGRITRRGLCRHRRILV